MRRLDVEKVIDTKDVEKLVNSDASKSSKIKEMFDGGMDVKEISAALEIRYNHAYNVIQNYVIVNGIEVEKASRGTSEKRAEIETLLLEGKRNIDVAKATRTTYNYIWKVKNDMIQDGRLVVEKLAEGKITEDEPVKKTKKGSKVGA